VPRFAIPPVQSGTVESIVGFYNWVEYGGCSRLGTVYKIHSPLGGQMRLGIFILAFQLALAVGQTGHVPQTPRSQAAGTSSIAENLVGAWRLISIETTRSTGEVIYPFYGKHPEGLLVYDRSGWMSVQIISDPKPNLPLASSREDFLKAKPEEKVNAIDGYYAYFGTWTCDASASTVTHHIEQSLDPGERGEDAVRHMSLEGNRLTLVAKAHEMDEDHQRRLVWERIAPALHEP
jgi:hypothetical protein